MPTAVRQPGPRQTAALRSGDESTVGRPPLEDLLPAGGAFAPAPAPAPHRALALDALRLRAGLRHAHRRPPRWADAAFGREVELIRRHLAPFSNRRSLAASFGREAFQGLEVDPAAAPALGPIRAAYAIRWLELGNGASLPAWPALVRADAD